MTKYVIMLILSLIDFTATVIAMPVVFLYGVYSSDVPEAFASFYQRIHYMIEDRKALWRRISPEKIN